MKLLIVEDELTLSKNLKKYFDKENNICEVASNYPDAHQKIHIYDYDCVFVDIMLPGGSGLKLIKELKDLHAEAGIIIISAKDSLDDRIKGLELGADDYLTKPFHLSELNARVKALIRRKKFNGDQKYNIGRLTIYPDRKEVFVKEKKLDLTVKEYDLLSYFISNKNRVLTKQAIAEHVWGDHYDVIDSFDFIYVHIRNVRKKIQSVCGDDPIKTIYGMGYKFQYP